MPEYPKSFWTIIPTRGSRGFMRCRVCIARRDDESSPTIHKLDSWRSKSSFRHEQSNYSNSGNRLKFKQGDTILVPVENLGSNHPIGIHRLRCEVGNLNLDNLDPQNQVIWLQIHGYFQINEPCPPQVGAPAHQWTKKDGDPFIIKPRATNETPTDEETGEVLIEALNLRTGEPTLVPPREVELFANHQYIGLSTDLFQDGEFVTVTQFFSRKVRQEGGGDLSLWYATSVRTGWGGWVYKNNLQPLHEEQMHDNNMVLSMLPRNPVLELSSNLQSMKIRDSRSEASRRKAMVKVESPEFQGFSSTDLNRRHNPLEEKTDDYYDDEEEVDPDDRVTRFHSHGLPSPISLYNDRSEGTLPQDSEASAPVKYLPEHELLTGPRGQKRLNLTTLQAKDGYNPPPPRPKVEKASLKGKRRVAKPGKNEVVEAPSASNLQEYPLPLQLLPPDHFHSLNEQIQREEATNKGLEMAERIVAEEHRVWKKQRDVRRFGQLEPMDEDEDRFLPPMFILNGQKVPFAESINSGSPQENLPSLYL
ncbi:hypothetical protein TWF694_000821 [Orbilia ellipsospora]|uniref:Uncharacterized protein n=1 Tax=Orbilia ellipsospora TaxID=2528407 RepID=A0AAV9XQ73_9PEZI